MPDYSEFPTTPTAWQEVHATDWQPVLPLAIEEPAPPQRRPDRVALVAGIAFVALALGFLTDIGVPGGLLGNGGILWLVLIGAGVALLVGELRKARGTRKT